jgi:3-isopropylmalate dehydrogenase
MTHNVLVLPGDGIGPEIVAEAEKVLHAVDHKFDLGLNISRALVGGSAIDATGGRCYFIRCRGRA